MARVQEAFAEAKVDYDSGLAPNANFSRAIKALARERGKPVVVLIDEYDAPVGAALNDIEKATAIRAALSSFYGEIKNNVSYIRFMMMTGVTKFTQLSVFSALNNLVDLTLQPEAATLLGYTEEELDRYFGEHLRAHTKVMGLSDEDYRSQLRWWYNGYRFSPDSETKVYKSVRYRKVFLAKRRNICGSNCGVSGDAGDTGDAGAPLRGDGEGAVQGRRKPRKAKPPNFQTSKLPIVQSACGSTPLICQNL